MVERNRLRSARIELHIEGVRIHKRAASRDIRDLAELRDLTDATRQLLDHTVLPLTQLVDVDLGCTELDAHDGRRFGFVKHFGSVEKSLRRNASAVETHATGILLGINKGSLKPKISG